MSKIKNICIISLIIASIFQVVPSYAKTSKKFKMPSIPKNHDFTKITANAEYKPGELLVRFAPKSDWSQKSTVEKQQILINLGGATIKRNFKIVPGACVVKLPYGLTVEAALKTFNKTAGIIYAEPNYKVKTISTFPNDPCFSQLWGMHNTGQTGGTEDADIDAPEAWDISTDSNDVIVAVIDTGLDYNHSDLTNNMWSNEAELNGTIGIDDDGNGKIDDIYGYDFCNNDSDPIDDHFHGTHCAGTIGALGNNGEGVVGVCWNVKIMALKFLDDEGSGDVSDAIDCIEYAVEMGADILSNSWGGGGCSQLLKDAIEDAGEADVMFIAAAGNRRWWETDEMLNNDEYPLYPASYDLDNIVAVLATDYNDNRSSFSHYGFKSVDLGAPGTDILSTFPTYETGAMSNYGFDTYYETISGTSMACPHVAGACALVWGLNPNLSHLSVKQIILDNVDQLDSLDGLCVTGGRLNLYKAVLDARALSLGIEDDVAGGACLDPCDLVEYIITYGNPVSDPCESGYLGDVNDVYIINYIPDGFTFISADPCDNGFYNSVERFYHWDIGTLQAGEGGDPCDPCFVTITLQVNSLSEPNGVITNEVIINNADNEFFNRVTVSAPVCCWCNGGIMYVNRSATGENTGVNWENAYTDLQHAMTMARACFRDEIWVAKGIYKPTYDPDNSDSTFELVSGVKLIGGFGGWESDSDQRKAQKYKTYLTGDIDGDRNSDINNVVSGFNVGSDTLIDGFIIGKSKNAAVYIEDAPPLIERNTIRENDEYGIYFKGTTETVVKNCWIHNNGDHGIYYHYTANGGLIRNCSIVSNAGQGVCNNGGDDPNIVNCVLWQNNSNGCQYTDCEVTYSDYKNPGDPNVYEPSPPDYNIHCDPCFIFEEFDEPNTYTCYLKTESACIDLGDPCGDYNGEYDINADERVIFEHADMGADEFSRRFCGASAADFDDDGVVGLADFARISEAWLTDPLDQNWDPCCDLDYDDEIALGDLTDFSDDWLLMLCSLLEQKYMENGPGTGMPPCPLYGGTWQIQYSSFDTSSSQSVVPTKSEPSIEELIEQFKNVIMQLETIWKLDRELIIKEVGEKEWFEFIDSLYKELEKLIEQLN